MVQKELEKCVKLYSNALKIKQYNNSIFEKKSGDYFLNYYAIIEIVKRINKLDDFFDFCYSLLKNYHLHFHHPSTIKYTINEEAVLSFENTCNDKINALLRALHLNYKFPKIPVEKITKVVTFVKDNNSDDDFEELYTLQFNLLNKVKKYIYESRFFDVDFHVFYLNNTNLNNVSKSELLENVVSDLKNILDKKLEYDFLFTEKNDAQHVVDLMLDCFWESFYYSQHIFSFDKKTTYYDFNETKEIDYEEFERNRLYKLYESFDNYLDKIPYYKFDEKECINIIELIKCMYPNIFNRNFFDTGEVSLNNLVGLNEIKENVIKIKNYCISHENEKINLHMCFTGNPGTGKTEVARIIGKIFKDNNILESGHLIEATRKDLVGLYVGHTAYKTNEFINRAMDGVLFIDEAYSLYQGEDDIFGREAIDTLIKAMEDYRGEFCVIFAGYKNDMNKLIESNDGLASRIQFNLDFPNYSRNELGQIAIIFLNDKEYNIEPDAFATLIDIIEYKKTNPNFANAREVRNAIERCILNQCYRCGDAKNDFNITLEDVKKYSDELKIYLPKTKKIRLKSAEEELEELVGLSAVKKMIKKIQAVIIKNESFKSLNLHMCFTGNPGTGKTAVANIMSRLLYDIGALPDSKIYAISAKDLIGEYVGQTGPKTQRAIDKAMGGVLFIDEAYSISMSPYGDEAIATLVQEMENKRGQFAVIFAGYKNETDEMLSKNPGLKSRIKFYLDFEDYNNDEIGQIIQMMIGDTYTITQEALDRMIDIVEYYRSFADFANARTARNLVEDVKMNQNYRTEYIEDNEITLDDVGEYIIDKKITVQYRNQKNIDKDFINKCKKELEMVEYFNVDTNIINNSYIEQCVVSIFSDNSQGTGFIFSPNGFVLTCAHCLTNNSFDQKIRIRVATSDNDIIDIIEDFVVIKKDEANDIAILKLKGKLNKYKFIPLCSRNDAIIEPLRQFYMVGYPFGGENFKNLSYIEGKIASVNKIGERKAVFADMFGKPGNSGGPIIDALNKNIIGIYWGGIKKGDDVINCFTPIDIIWNLIDYKE